MSNVAHTILHQLGGARFVAMTGARDMVAGADRLTVKFPRMKGARVNCLRVTLTAMDDYQIEGFAMRGLDCKPVAFKDGVLADGLRAAVARVIQRDVSL